MKENQGTLKEIKSKEQYIKLSDYPELINQAADWFHQKWHIPADAYLDSMNESFTSYIPSWYIVMDEEKIIAGLGVIENDFHNRKDLTPNKCAVYDEESYRCQGIAGKMLKMVCDDMAIFGMDTLYLLTDHDSFYERYGWEFLCMVQGDGEESMSRMYVHKQ